jgi:hypothetical protein
MVYLMSVEEALRLNTAEPLPGLDGVLHDYRARLGLRGVLSVCIDGCWCIFAPVDEHASH